MTFIQFKLLNYALLLLDMLYVECSIIFTFNSLIVCHFQKQNNPLYLISIHKS